MTLRRQSALGTRNARRAFVAALRVRPRLTHGATQSGPTADASFFSSLLTLPPPPPPFTPYRAGMYRQVKLEHS